MLLCLVLLLWNNACEASTHGMQHKHPQILMYNFVHDLSCPLHTPDARQHMLNMTSLYLAAKEWSATHEISHWQSTVFRTNAHTTPTDLESDHYRQEYSIPADAVQARVQYTSSVHLPGVLSPVMNVDVKLYIVKYVYVSQDLLPTLHTVTEITGLPFLDECVIYSRNVAAADNRILSRNTAAFPAIPWYLKLFQPVIEQSLRDSLWRNTWALARAWCGEL